MKNQQNTNNNPFALTLALAFILVLCSSLAFVPRVHAATPFTLAFVRLDRLKAVTQTSGRVCFKPTSATAIKSVQVVFPTTGGTDYVVNSTAANWSLNATNMDTGQTALTNLPANPTISGKTMTVTLSATVTPVVTNIYCFNWTWTTNSVTTPTLTTSSAGAAETTQGTVTTFDAGAATINQSAYSESIITDDQVIVNATVPPSFTFFLSGNTDSFSGNLSTSAVNQSTGRFITIVTNASDGWIVWAKGTNNNGGKGALTSITAGNYNITGSGAVHTGRTFATGGEDYGLSVFSKTDAVGGGTVTINGAYDAVTNGSNWGSTIDPVVYRPIASASGTANTDRIDFRELVTIGGMTPAASDYTDTLTFVGAGQF